MRRRSHDRGPVVFLHRLRANQIARGKLMGDRPRFIKAAGDLSLAAFAKSGGDVVFGSLLAGINAKLRIKTAYHGICGIILQIAGIHSRKMRGDILPTVCSRDFGRSYWRIV